MRAPVKKLYSLKSNHFIHAKRANRTIKRMDIVSLLRRFPCTPRGMARMVYSRSRLVWLRVVNRYGRSPITEPAGPVVSLTSHGTRIKSVHLAIESIGRGQIRPSRLILWLDDASMIENLPIGIRRLQKRGLEVLLSKNYGPHTKYYPYVERLQKCEVPLVTADDDVLYPKYWLKSLLDAYQRFPEVVNCHRARVIAMTHDGIARYDTWPQADSTDQSLSLFALGIGGALYPPRLLERLKHEGTAFLNCCPKADDVWLHAQALRTGFKIRQVAPRAFRPMIIPGTQNNALNHGNLAGGENDRQIETTYGTADIERLRERQ